MSSSRIETVQQDQYFEGFKPTSLNAYLDEVRSQFGHIISSEHLEMKLVQIRAVHDFIAELMQSFRVVNVKSYETLYRFAEVEATPLQVLGYVYADIIADLHVPVDGELIAICIDFHQKFNDLEEVVRVTSKMDEAVKTQITNIWEKCLNKYIPNRSAALA